MDKNKIKLYFPLILSGFLTGALQTCMTFPLFAFASLVPLIRSVSNFKSVKDYYMNISAFLLPYYLVQTVFLFTVYDLLEMPLVISLLIAFLLVCAVALWLTFLMFVPLAFYPLVRKDKKHDLMFFVLLFVLGECIAEYVPFLSFPWSGLWQSVISEPLLIQPAALLGCRFVSFIILLGNCLVTTAFFSKSKKTAVKNAAMFALLLMSAISYSIVHISQIKSAFAKSEPIKVMAAQDNLVGKDKGKVSLSDAVATYISIMEQNWQKGVKLVVLPETAVPKSYDEKSEDFQKLCRFAKDKNTTVLTGCFAIVDRKRYNAMYSVTADGFCDAPYLKQILVPFGEKIPLASLWGASTITCGESADKHCLQTDEGIKTANVICIESIYPSLARQQIKDGGELLCVSTNDSWFGKSYARLVHYRHTLMRATESGRYTIRAGNCGVSAIISPWGEVKASETRAVKSAVCANVYRSQKINLYTRLGDVIMLPGLIIVVLHLPEALSGMFKKLKVKKN